MSAAVQKQGVRPVALCILDGLGLSYMKKANAYALAQTPVLDDLLARYPFTTLRASGEAVGLAEGQMGDSNVGHLNLGAGRIIYQELVRIDKAIESGVFFESAALVDAYRRAAAPGRTLHLIGLVSDGGVHSHYRHLFALLEGAAEAGVSRVAIHALLDGRDVAPTSAAGYLETVEAACREAGLGVIASVGGRYYGMDRDNRWERTGEAYDAIVHGRSRAGRTATAAAALLQQAYDARETDEFVRPGVVVDSSGEPLAPVRDGDAVVFFNFRADRARQLTRALTQPDFSGFDRGGPPPDICFVGMTPYDDTFGLPSIFVRQTVDKPLGQVVSAAGLKQFRVAETEKYAHVTFFFNGGNETVFPGEERLLVPSPKVPTYDLQPEMSAPGVAAAAAEAVRSGEYHLTVVNFANPDMVGHTGVLEAAVRAVETVDTCLGQVVAACRETGTALLVLADHGNCEQMIDYATGQPHTNHTLNPVPCVLVADDMIGRTLRPGVLADVAPTLLKLMGLDQPEEMNRQPLLVDTADGDN